jgi:hypothetical protein
MNVDIDTLDARIKILSKALEIGANLDDTEVVILAEAYSFIQDNWYDTSLKKTIDAYEVMIEWYANPVMKEWFDQLPRGKQVDPYD